MADEPVDRERLIRNLTDVRTYGLETPGLVYMHALLKIARRLTTEGSDGERVEAALLLAINDYGECRDRDVARLWFGLDPSTRGLDSRKRLEAAAKRWEGQRAESTVRTKDGPRIVRFLAERLLARYEQPRVEQAAETHQQAAIELDQPEGSSDGSSRGAIWAWLVVRRKWGIAAFALLVGLIGILLSGALSGLESRSTGPSRPPHVAGPTWGPSRPAFTSQHPATYATFDSITNNPAAGDERRFLAVGIPGTTTWQHVLKVDNHETVSVRAFFENSVASNLNDYAHGTTIRLLVPDKTAARQRIVAEISAVDTKPRMVWSSVQLYADKPFRVRYILGTAKLWNNASESGTPYGGGISLQDYLVIADGVYLGCGRNLNGEVSGDMGNCSGWVTAHLLIEYV